MKVRTVFVGTFFPTKNWKTINNRVSYYKCVYIHIWSSCKKLKPQPYLIFWFASSRLHDMYIYIYYIYIIYINTYMGLRQNSGMDRPAVIQTYGSVWITCVLVWIGGMDRPVGSGYGSGLYILTRSHINVLYTYCKIA